MEAAGRAVAGNVQVHWPRQEIIVLCGPGNNGGDGFVAAHHLAEAGWSVRLALLGSVKDLPGDASHHARLWWGTVEPFYLEVLDGAGAVIDAIFGAGLARPVEGAAAEMIQSVRARKLPVYAIDVPSGLDGATGEIRGTAPCTVLRRFWRQRQRRLCEVERSGTKHSRRKQISTAFLNRAARRERPYRPCAPDYRRAPAWDTCPGGWPR